jgi:hypothetical protein
MATAPSIDIEQGIAQTQKERQENQVGIHLVFSGDGALTASINMRSAFDDAIVSSTSGSAVVQFGHTKSYSSRRLEFKTLVQEWKRDTRFKSFLGDRVTHPSYLAIIGMGPDAVPLIIEDLRNTREHWLVALHAITRQDPAPSNATFGDAVDAWLAWGKEQGYP